MMWPHLAHSFDLLCIIRASFELLLRRLRASTHSLRCSITSLMFPATSQLVPEPKPPAECTAEELSERRVDSKDGG